VAILKIRKKEQDCFVPLKNSGTRNDNPLVLTQSRNPWHKRRAKRSPASLAITAFDAASYPLIKIKIPSGYSPNGILFVTPQDNLRNLPSALNLRHQRNPFDKGKQQVYTDQ
jgi:hypothetical protein